MWTGRHAIAAIALTGATACSDPGPGAPRFAELCGAQGPVRLYQPVVTPPAADGFHLNGIDRIGDRWILSLSDRHRPYETYPDGVYDQIHYRIVSVDECGGDALVLFDGPAFIVDPDRRIVCHDGKVGRFDPMGSEPTRWYPEIFECPNLAADGNLMISARHADDFRISDLYGVTFDEGWNATVSLAEANVVKWDWYRRIEPPRPVLALNEEGEMLELDLGTRTRTVVHSGVRGIVTKWGSGDGHRFVAWSPDTEADHVGGPAGTWYLWDRDENAERRLGRNGRDVVVWGHGEVLTATYETDQPSGPTIEPRTVTEHFDATAPDGLVFDESDHVSSALEDGRRVIRTEQAHSPVYIYEPQSQTLRETGYVDGPGSTFVKDGDFILTTPSERDISGEWRMWRLDPDARAPVLAVDRIVDPYYLGDRLWATVRDPSHAMTGPLVVLEEGGDVPFIVAEDVEANLGFANGHPYDEPFPPPTVDGPLLYTVQDPTGERAGIWMVQIERG